MRWTITKKMEISASHHLNLEHPSPCLRFHGHNFFVWVTVQGTKLNGEGMLIDFMAIKQLVHGKLDHQYLNNLFSFNPTAENIASWIATEVQFELDKTNPNIKVTKVEVQESEGNTAVCEPFESMP